MKSFDVSHAFSADLIDPITGRRLAAVSRSLASLFDRQNLAMGAIDENVATGTRDRFTDEYLEIAGAASTRLTADCADLARSVAHETGGTQ